jgi:hypothetical protein
MEESYATKLENLTKALKSTKTFSEWKSDSLNRELPRYFESFLDLWLPFISNPVFYDARADDPIWDFTPEICGWSDSGKYGHQGYTYQNATFVGFWHPDGRLAFPAVTTQNVLLTHQPAVMRRGQTVRDAFLRKGAKWITILTVKGDIDTIELLNLVHCIPMAIKEREFREGHIPPQATLSVYTVVECPPPATIKQWMWSKWRHLTKGNPLWD